MKTVGIIAEYNPFHNGHKYQIEEAKKITGADYVVIIMSGDFVQRGTPAITNKYIRTQMALNGGADIVFELPIIYSTASAEYFAKGGVSLLNKLSCIDYLCFGSESGDISLLSSIADVLLSEPASFKEDLKTKLKEGFSFPAAREYALIHYFMASANDSLNPSHHIMQMSNNILGVEYLKALKSVNSPITPITIKRKGSHYHEDKLSDDCFSSASAVRSFIENLWKTNPYPKDNEALDFSGKAIPDNIKDTFLNSLSSSIQQDNLNMIYNNFGSHHPITPDDFSLLIQYAMKFFTAEQILETADFTDEIYNKLKNKPAVPFYFTELSAYLKSKKYTFTRIQRMLLHLILNIKKTDMNMLSQPCRGYLRLLGFKKHSSPLLRYMQDNSELSIITKPADANKALSEQEYHMFKKDISASRLYNDICAEKFKFHPIDEYKQNIIIK